MIFALLFCLILTSVSGLKLYGIEGYGPLASSTVDSSSSAAGFSLIRPAYARDYYKKAYREYYRGRSGEREEFWEELHEFFAQLTPLFVFIHIAGAIVASLAHRENLIKAMITGTKIQHSSDRTD